MPENARFDLLELLNTGRSGPVAFGQDRYAIRDVFDAGDINVDGVHDHSDFGTRWRIYGPSCELFFDADYRLRHIKLLPNRFMGAFGSAMPEWSGASSLELGRYEAVFGGEAVTAIDALPGAIRTVQKHALSATFGSDEANNAIWIGMQDGERSLTLLYQLQTLRIESVPGPTLRVDYFLSDVWIVDDAFPA